MRKILLSGLGIVLFTACDQKDTRHAQQSPEIDIVKKAITDYNTREYDLSIYADTSKTFFNTKSNPLEADEIIAYHQANDAIIQVPLLYHFDYQDPIWIKIHKLKDTRFPGP